MHVYKERREKLLQAIKLAHPQVTRGCVMLFGGFEGERSRFRQESSFYYLTGIEEPGVAMRIDISGKTTLYIPHTGGTRARWMANSLTLESAKKCGVDEVRYAGDAITGYTFSPLFTPDEYATIIADITADLHHDGTIFTLNSPDRSSYLEQKQLLLRLAIMIAGFDKVLVDISALVARMRRKKSREEVELLYKAIELTMIAQHGAAGAMTDGQSEATLQAGIEYIFTEELGRVAFPSIVGSGGNSTVLHYHDNNAIMHDGDLVVIDIGAEVDYYCADITRTYPVSGTFSRRQKEIYTLVLEAQELVASQAKPGMYLKNPKYPDQSLHHIAKNFLDKAGYGQYFTHGIGHYLGMDVHDVGSYDEVLEEGDVITIEPGIYIPDERIGVRIEDDYWLIKGGAECLSYELVKDVQGIEELAQSTLICDEQEEDMDDFN